MQKRDDDDNNGTSSNKNMSKVMEAVGDSSGGNIYSDNITPSDIYLWSYRDTVPRQDN